jgi:hypothetical protein
MAPAERSAGVFVFASRRIGTRRIDGQAGMPGALAMFTGADRKLSAENQNDAFDPLQT